MRKITDIYTQYHTMPNLQMHQFRVAAVALFLCDHFDIPLQKDAVVLGCLLHDIGNIVKFRLRAFPEMLEGQDVDYWEAIQKEYRERYGEEEHEANMGLARTIGVSPEVLAVVDAVGFHNWCAVQGEGSWEHKIASYADSRVAPFGVLSLDERLMDANKRYADVSLTPDETRDMLYACMRNVEKDIFSHITLSPEDVNDISIAPYIEKLKNFEF